MDVKQGRALALGLALKDARRAQGLTRCALAEAAGVSLSAAKAAEQGRGQVETLDALAGALGLRLAARQTGGPLDGLAAIRARQMSRRAVAEASGLSRGTVEAVEKGHRAARVETLAEYAAAIGAGLTLAPTGAGVAFFAGAGNASGWHGWETPPGLFDAIERGAGAFDLDPCAPDKPGTVRAARRYTAAQDGLGREWRGRVFMNPPYGRALPLWLAKAAQEARAGAEVVGLIPARPDTGAWHRYIAGRAWVFMLRGRVAFGDGTRPAPFPSAVVVWGAQPGTVEGLRRELADAWAIPPQGV